MNRPYGDQAGAYWRAGWVNPIPVEKKFPPVTGYTGKDGANVSWPDIQAWSDDHRAGWNIALRHADTVGIDIDGPVGAATIRAAEAVLGPLPATAWITAREPDGPRRTLVYRLPGLVDLAHGEGRLRKEYGPEVDIIHRGHRYSVVWPSVHPDTLTVYQWYADDGGLPRGYDGVPDKAALPFLPDAWIDYLSRTDQPTDTDDLFSSPASTFTNEPPISWDSAVDRVERLIDKFRAMDPDTDTGFESALNTTSLIVGHYVGAGVIEARTAAQRLYQAAEHNGCVTVKGTTSYKPMGDTAVKAKITRGIRDGAKTPKAVKQKRSSDNSTDDEDQGDPERRPAAEPAGEANQLLLADFIVADHTDEMRYVHGLGWHIWRGTHWGEDLDGHPIRSARGCVDTHRAQLTDDKGKCKIASAFDIKGALEIAKALHPVAVSYKAINQHPELFNTPTGTLDLGTGEMVEHDRAHLITKIAGAGPDPDADSALFDKFITRILPDVEVRTFVQRLLGQAMYGAVHEHILPIWHGVGANGKSVLQNLVHEAFGEYSTVLSPELLLESKHSAHTTELTDLLGKRLAWTSETNEGRKLNAALVKRLTGGDPITARRMRQDDMTWTPTHSLIMVTNYPPVVNGDDEAMWRRVMVVPFDVVIPTGERDAHLTDKLRADLGAVMRWVFDGYREYQRIGLAVPEAVRVRTTAVRGESDITGRFIEERVHVTGSYGSTTATRMYDEWQTWCRANGEEPGGVISFGRMLEKRGYTKLHERDGWRWQGLTIRTQEGNGQ